MHQEDNMKIRLGDLRRIIHEVAGEASAQRWNPEVPTLDEINGKSEMYRKAYADLMAFLKKWDISYKEEGPEGMLPGTMRRMASAREPLISPAWDSLMPFEKYCVMSGDPKKSAECEAILQAAGASYGAVSSSNMSFKQSGDYFELADHLMGGSRFKGETDHARGYNAYERAATNASMAREKSAKAAEARAAKDRKNAAARAKRATAKPGV